MRREDTVSLDTHALVRRIQALGLKQAWIASQVGVDRKTVSRWVTGKVKRLAREHAARLAEVVACPARELTRSDEADVLATKEEQRVAARLIQERDLLARLAPTDDWRLAEGLIRATLQPDLPAGTLGRLYNLLATAAWRQGKYGEASRHVARARELGARAGDRGVLCGATYNQAVIDSLRGDHTAALAAYERCLARPDDFDTTRERGKVLSNLAVAYLSVGRAADALATQREAIRVFEGLGLDLNLAIAWVSQGVTATALGRLDEALAAHARAEAHARRAGYARGVDCAPLYRADPLSLSGRTRAARALVEGALPALARHDVYDLGCHEAAARVLRRAGDLEGAARQLEEGLGRARAADLPETLAHLQVEAARLAQARGDARGEVRARRAANAAFRRAGLPMRALDGPPAEHGTPVKSREALTGPPEATTIARSRPEPPGASPRRSAATREACVSGDEDLDLRGVSSGERKAFMRVLSSLAWADGEADESELEVLHLAANDLRVALSERDLEPQDLEALAAKVTRPSLQERLLHELRRLAEADLRLDPGELSTIKLFATRWGCVPPPIEGVDWSTVELPSG